MKGVSAGAPGHPGDGGAPPNLPSEGRRVVGDAAAASRAGSIVPVVRANEGPAADAPPRRGRTAERQRHRIEQAFPSYVAGAALGQVMEILTNGRRPKTAATRDAPQHLLPLVRCAEPVGKGGAACGRKLSLAVKNGWFVGYSAPNCHVRRHGLTVNRTVEVAVLRELARLFAPDALAHLADATWLRDHASRQDVTQLKRAVRDLAARLRAASEAHLDARLDGDPEEIQRARSREREAAAQLREAEDRLRHQQERVASLAPLLPAEAERVVALARDLPGLLARLHDDPARIQRIVAAFVRAVHVRRASAYLLDVGLEFPTGYVHWFRTVGRLSASTAAVREFVTAACASSASYASIATCLSARLGTAERGTRWTAERVEALLWFAAEHGPGQFDPRLPLPAGTAFAAMWDAWYGPGAGPTSALHETAPASVPGAGPALEEAAPSDVIGDPGAVDPAGVPRRLAGRALQLALRRVSLSERTVPFWAEAGSLARCVAQAQLEAVDGESAQVSPTAEASAWRPILQNRVGHVIAEGLRCWVLTSASRVHAAYPEYGRVIVAELNNWPLDDVLRTAEIERTLGIERVNAAKRAAAGNGMRRDAALRWYVRASDVIAAVRAEIAFGFDGPADPRHALDPRGWVPALHAARVTGASPAALAAQYPSVRSQPATGGGRLWLWAPNLTKNGASRWPATLADAVRQQAPAWTPDDFVDCAAGRGLLFERFGWPSVSTWNRAIRKGLITAVKVADSRTQTGWRRHVAIPRHVRQTDDPAVVLAWLAGRGLPDADLLERRGAADPAGRVARRAARRA